MGRKKVYIGGEVALKYDTELPRIAEKNTMTDIWARLDLQPNSIIQKIYKKGTIMINGKEEKLTSSINPAEGFHLYNIITLNNFKNALEIGMANGLSSLYITEALKKINGNKLISIDPFQSSQWKSVGITHIKEAHLEKYHELIEKPDYIALPELLNRPKFDLIFIDGMHLFDYTLLDTFYGIMLCKIGGVIIIDDILHKGPAKCIKYIDSNYKCLKRIYTTPCKTMATYVKLSEDERKWNFHANF